jgi:hypothetical protein
MADSLLFAGGTDRRQFDQGTVVGTGAVSVAAIVKRTGADGGGSTYSWFCRFQNTGADSFPLGLLDPALAGTNLVITTWDGATEVQADPTITTVLNEWYLVGVSKASGTATPRYHIYRYSTAQWEHGNFGGSIGNYAAPDQGIVWGLEGGEGLVGNLLIGAIWDSNVADGTFETLAFNMPAWVTAAPKEGYRFDRTSAITPFVGTGTQSANGSETLDVGDAPAGWSDTAAVADVPRFQIRRSRGTSW